MTLKQRHFIDPVPPPARGMAALSVVMVLFFVMAMVAAYTSRNMVFEQRISANNYRSARALQAADAAVEWTVAMLNGGRIDDNCVPSTKAGDVDFRSRYLVESTDPANPEGSYGLAWGGNIANRVYPACVERDGALSCICPTLGGVVPAMPVPADGIATAFRVQFILPGNAMRAGSMEISTRGCGSPGNGNTACYAQAAPPPAPVVDGLAGTLTTLGLVSALPVPPVATLTAGGNITAAAGQQLSIVNGDANTGLTAHAGGAINVPTGQFAGPAGSASDGRSGSDAALANLAAVPAAAATCPNSNATADCLFHALFGMAPDLFQRLPSVAYVKCPAGGCALADINATLVGYPRNPVWVEGNLTLDAAANLGNLGDPLNPLVPAAAPVPPAPLMLIVNGDLTLSASVNIVGFVYANNISWAAGADAAAVNGAMVARNQFTATTTATLNYNKLVMDTLRLRYGTFVRSPGSWNLDER